MRVHATKKLAEKLQKVGFELSESPEANPSALGDWHANITTIQRRQCIVFVHDETRFAIALTGVTQKELKSLDYWFTDMVGCAMLKLGYPEELIEKAQNAINGLTFDTVCSRSVQGTLRLVIGDIEAYTWNGTNIMDLGPYSLSASLCDRPCQIKGRKDYLWPAEEMRQLLARLPTAQQVRH